MAAQIPDSRDVERTVAVLNTDKVVSDAQLRGLLESPALNTGLDRWQLWTLLCLCRHIGRQKWVGYIVETRLKGDLAKLGTAGAFAHPDEIPQERQVPDEPGWRYYFHGGGCCLTHENEGTTIDVDFTEEGASDRIDRFFYSRFLEDLKRPEFPESLLQRKAPLQHAWQADVDALTLQGCIEAQRGIRVTKIGKNLADALEPVVAQMAELFKPNSTSARRRLIYAALSLGDVLFALELKSTAGVGEELAAEIERAGEEVRRRRAASIIATLGTAPAGTDSRYLAALADLGTRYAKSVVTECLSERRLMASPTKRWQFL